MIDLHGKNAIVTGASGGIGQAVAATLAAAGANVAVCGQNPGRLDRAAQGVRDAGADVRVVTADLRDDTGIKGAVETVLEAWGRVDILVNNAGITRDGLIMRMSDADWDEVMEVNLKSIFRFTRAVARPMMKQRSGAIVNMASVIGLIGNPGQANYAASKGAIIAFTKSIARELAGRGIRANAVAPGFIETPMTDGIPDDLQKKMLESIPLGRYGKPEDVADAVAFLASDRAAYITGQVITVCGGMVMS